jgi:hypothetical protein
MSFEPIVVLGVHFLFVKHDAFFHGRSFEPVSKGSDSAPLLVASLFGAKVLVKYGANFVSDLDCGLILWGMKLLLLLRGT